jgi:hypothetical protein
MKPISSLALVLGIALAPSPVLAQDAWPNRSITFLVPYAPGGYTDLVARLTARYVEKQLGKPVIIDNRAGAGGIVGTQMVANAAPDGYTYCVCSIGAISIAPFAQKIGYDPLQELAPVGIISTIVQVVIVRKDLPVKTMAELVAYAKANPGKLNYGSSGAGGLTNYSVELFQARTGTKVVHIPFKGGAPSTAAVVSGEVDFAFGNMTDALPQPLFPGSAFSARDGRPQLHRRDVEWNHGAGEDPGAHHQQAVRGLHQNGRRSRGEGDHAQGRRQHGQEHARSVSGADRAGDGAVEAADQGDRGQELIGEGAATQPSKWCTS